MEKLFKSILEYFSVFLILFLIIIVITAVAARILDISITWYDELASVVLVWLTYIGGAYVALIRGHMSFDGLLMSLSPKLQKIVFAIAEITVMAFFLIMGYYGYLVLDVFADETMVSIPWVHLSFTQAVIPIASVLFILARLFAMPRAWQALQAGKDGDAEYIDDVVSHAEKEMKNHR